jgi:signal transduction histidine kinase
MRTQHKLIIVLSITLLVSIITTVIIYKINLHQRKTLKELYSSQLQKNIKILINLNTSRLKQAANDYTFWDEMVEFVHFRDKEWADENIKTMLVNFKVDAVWVFDTLRNNFYHETNGIPDNLLVFPASKAIIDTLYKNRFVHTYVYTDSILIEIIGATIHPTNDPEKYSRPHGYFFIAKIWDQRYFQLTEQITETKIKLTATNHEHCNNRSRNNKIVVFEPLYDWQNKSVRFIRVEKTFDFLKIYQKASNKMLGLIIFSALLVLGIFAYASAILVNKPLRLIEEILEKKDTTKIRKLKSFSKEFKHIGRLIVNFFNKNEELRIATEKAEKSNQLKTAFLLNMNHEIRTPMNGVIGFSELLINNNLSAEMKQEYSNCIRNSCNNLIDIIDNIIDISKIEAKEITVVNNDFFINELFQELSVIFTHKISTAGKSHVHLHFIDIYNNTKFRVHSDRKLLQKVLGHLIGNAIKFTDKGHIEISYYINSENDLVFYIKDTGIGIPSDKYEIIFERFRQGDESSTRSFGGNGLGLAICKGLVTLMGGKIWFNSEFSKGSTFYFSLPDTTH